MQREKGNPRFTIDVEKVLKDKNPALHKKLPRFAIRWLEKIVYQDQLNDFLGECGHMDGCDFTDGMMKYNNIDLEIKGMENIPKDGKLTFASNHPMGGLDGMMLVSAIGKVYPEFKVLVNDILMNILNLENIFLPINKHGAQAKEAAMIINKAFESDIPVCVFPAGLVSRKRHGVIKDLEWKKNFIHKSVQHKRDIVPLHISGRNTNRFYRAARLREFLGIKANLEMTLLPSEVFKFRDKKMTITFGKPIKYNTFDRSKSHLEWANYVKEIVYKLPNT